MRVTIVILGMFFAASTAVGFERATGRGDGLGATIVLSRPTASEATIVPDLTKATASVEFESGYRRRFELRALDQLFVATSVRRGSWSLAMSLSQFGHADLYRELTTRVAAGRDFGAIAALVSWTGMLVDFGGDYARLDAGTLNLGLAGRRGRVHVAFAASNLTSPRLDNGSPRFRPDYTAFLELTVLGRHSLLGRVTVQEDSRPSFGLGQVINLTSYSALHWGISTAPTQYGGGVRIDFGAQGLTYCTRYHPTLGFTHVVSLTLSVARSPSSK